MYRERRKLPSRWGGAGRGDDSRGGVGAGLAGGTLGKTVLRGIPRKQPRWGRAGGPGKRGQGSGVVTGTGKVQAGRGKWEAQVTARGERIAGKVSIKCWAAWAEQARGAARWHGRQAAKQQHHVHAASHDGQCRTNSDKAGEVYRAAGKRKSGPGQVGRGGRDGQQGWGWVGKHFTVLHEPKKEFHSE